MDRHEHIVTEPFIIAQIERFRKLKNINVKDFAESIGLQGNSYRNMISATSNTPVSKNVIIKILDTYPELNAEWLFRGYDKPGKSQDMNESEGIYAAKDNDISEILAIVRRLEAAWNSIYKR